MRPAPLLALALALAVAGCGGTSTGSAAHTATSRDQLRADAVGTDGLSVCTLVPLATVQRVVRVAGLRAAANDSLDLSQCRYATRRARVRVLLDAAIRRRG